MEERKPLKEIKLLLENNNKNYNVLINKSSNFLFIQIITDEINKKEYFKEFSLNDLIQYGKFFKYFEDIDSIIITLKEIFEIKKPIINEQNNHIEFTIIPILSIMGEVKLIIPKINTEDKEAIDKLNFIIEEQAKDIKDLKKRILLLEEKMELFEHSSLYKRMINAKNLIGDIIKNYEQCFLICDWINPHGILEFELLYRGHKDGDLLEIFHNKCDNKGPTISIIESTDGQIFGGYTTKPWNINGSTSIDPKIFLFNLNNKKKYCSSENGCIINNLDLLCHFGEIDSHILGAYNNFFSGGGFCENNNGFKIENHELTGGFGNFKIKEIEVFKVIDPDLKILDDRKIATQYLEPN